MKPNKYLPFVFQWRNAVRSSSLPATTKQILVELSFYMKQDGSDCYPSIRQLQNKTSLSRRAIIKHLTWAKNNGWLHIWKAKEKVTSKWRNNRYWPRIPEGAQDAPSAFTHKVHPNPWMVHSIRKCGVWRAP